MVVKSRKGFLALLKMFFVGICLHFWPLICPILFHIFLKASPRFGKVLPAVRQPRSICDVDSATEACYSCKEQKLVRCLLFGSCMRQIVLYTYIYLYLCIYYSKSQNIHVLHIVFICVYVICCFSIGRGQVMLLRLCWLLAHEARLSTSTCLLLRRG